MVLSICFFFFFQAEDGIRDVAVTGVQTCALPISLCGHHQGKENQGEKWQQIDQRLERQQIGRASWRERGEISVVAGSLKKKKKKHNRKPETARRQQGEGGDARHGRR